MKSGKKLLIFILLMLTIVAVGIVGYLLLLHVGFIDALYMTIITISTVGFSEVAVMSDAAKVFSIFLIFAGLTVVAYGFTSFVTYLFGGELQDTWRKKRMSDKISHLNGHYIICGAGDVGSTVISCLKSTGSAFVVIESNEKRHEELVAEGVLTLNGDATHDETLMKAGIMRAKGIVCTLSSDSDNVFTVLTAKGLNEKIYIVARAVERTAHSKLMKAGANRTISPNEIGGQRIAAAMVRPSMTSFFDIMTRAGDLLLDLEELVISPGSKICGLRLREAKIPQKTGLIVLALKKKNAETFSVNPGADEILEEGDILIALGTSEQAERLKTFVNG